MRDSVYLSRPEICASCVLRFHLRESRFDFDGLFPDNVLHFTDTMTGSLIEARLHPRSAG